MDSLSNNFNHRANVYQPIPVNSLKATFDNAANPVMDDMKNGMNIGVRNNFNNQAIDMGRVNGVKMSINDPSLKVPNAMPESTLGGLFGAVGGVVRELGDVGNKPEPAPEISTSPDVNYQMSLGM